MEHPSSEGLCAEIIPASGARISSLLKGVRLDLMWAPTPKGRLFASAPCGDITNVCIPTILAYIRQGRNYPGYGEAWSAPAGDGRSARETPAPSHNFLDSEHCNHDQESCVL